MVDEAWLEVGPPPGVAPPILAQELVVAAVPVQEAGEMALARQLAKLTLAPQLPKLTGPAPASLALERRQDMPGALRRSSKRALQVRASFSVLSYCGRSSLRKLRPVARSWKVAAAAGIT